MELTAVLKENGRSRMVSFELPTVVNQMFNVTLVDPRWCRPFPLQDPSHYPWAGPANVSNDFARYVQLVNMSTKSTQIERFKDGLLKIADEHIAKYRRLLFCDLLHYVDCMAYLCYASDLMTEQQVAANYALWAKFAVDSKGAFIQASTRFGGVSFCGSANESDLLDCL